jgi:hypothetical protein
MRQLKFPVGAIIAVILFIYTIQEGIWGMLSDWGKFFLAVALVLLFFADMEYLSYDKSKPEGVE